MTQFLDAVDMAGHWFFATAVVCVGIPLLLLLYVFVPDRKGVATTYRTMLDGEKEVGP